MDIREAMKRYPHYACARVTAVATPDGLLLRLHQFADGIDSRLLTSREDFGWLQSALNRAQVAQGDRTPVYDLFHKATAERFAIDQDRDQAWRVAGELRKALSEARVEIAQLRAEKAKAPSAASESILQFAVHHFTPARATTDAGPDGWFTVDLFLEGVSAKVNAYARQAIPPAEAVRKGDVFLLRAWTRAPDQNYAPRACDLVRVRQGRYQLGIFALLERIEGAHGPARGLASGETEDPFGDERKLDQAVQEVRAWAASDLLNNPEKP